MPFENTNSGYPIFKTKDCKTENIARYIPHKAVNIDSIPGPLVHRLNAVPFFTYCKSMDTTKKNSLIKNGRQNAQKEAKMDISEKKFQQHRVSRKKSSRCNKLFLEKWFLEKWFPEKWFL